MIGNAYMRSCCYVDAGISVTCHYCLCGMKRCCADERFLHVIHAKVRMCAHYKAAHLVRSHAQACEHTDDSQPWWRTS